MTESLETLAHVRAHPFPYRRPHPISDCMHETIVHLGLIDDEDIALDEAALSLALIDHVGTDPAACHELLDAMEARLAAVGYDAGMPADRADALAAVLAGEFGLAGDTETYDDPANADLISVLHRRRGLPVSLSILWVAMARRLGWSAEVLDVPGHVLVVIGSEAAPVIVDPFAGGVRVDAERLAAMAEASFGSGRAVRHLAAMPNRAVLVRLLQNQASRAEQAGRGRRALLLYVRMTTIAPTIRTAGGHAPDWNWPTKTPRQRGAALGPCWRSRATRICVGA